MTTILERLETSSHFRMTHEGNTYYIHDSFYHTTNEQDLEPEIEIVTRVATAGKGELSEYLDVTTKEYDAVRKVFFDFGLSPVYLVGIYVVSGAPGKGTAYRFVATLEEQILGVEYIDFSFLGDEVEDNHIEDLPDDAAWISFATNVKRHDECLNQVRDYLKTTDQAVQTHGMSRNLMPQWSKDLID